MSLDGLACRVKIKSFLEIGYGEGRAEDGEVGETTAEVGFGVFGVDLDGAG